MGALNNGGIFVSPQQTRIDDARHGDAQLGGRSRRVPEVSDRAPSREVEVDPGVATFPVRTRILQAATQRALTVSAVTNVVARRDYVPRDRGLRSFDSKF